jgi:surfeit locus 1 family protein
VAVPPHSTDPGAPQPARQPRPLSITPAGLAGTLLVVVAMAVCIRLGFWQLERLEERRQLNSHVGARLDAPPLHDAAALADTAGIFYRTAALHGTFDHERSIVLPGRSHRGVPGVHLITPLLVTGRSDAVLVNRGWVPSADAATIDVMDSTFTATTADSIRGLVLPFPGSAESLAQRARATDGNRGFRRVWYSVDGAALRAQYPYQLLPALLQALPDEAKPPAGRTGYPTRLEAPPLDEGPHLGYALQWFGFALIALIGWIALVLRSRAGPRAAPPPLVAALLLLTCAAPVRGQLRPIDPMDWRIFDPGVMASAAVGGSVLWQQTASLAGTRGRLSELGHYAVAYRSGRIAIALGGTALLRLSDEQVWTPPAGAARPADGRTRQEPGRATAATLLRLSGEEWPVDVVVRFGSVIPTTSDESGLDRDRTDFFALLGLRYTRGALALAMENGVGINGTIIDQYPQSDVWVYSFSASYDLPAAGTPLRGVATLIGHQDGHSWSVRGNEDLSELRLGLDVGTSRSLQLRYVRGIREFSPRHGFRLGASLLLHARNRPPAQLPKAGSATTCRACQM